MGMLLRGGRGEIGGLKGGSLLFSKGAVTLKGSRVGVVVGGNKKNKNRRRTLCELGEVGEATGLANSWGSLSWWWHNTSKRITAFGFHRTQTQ